MALFSREKHYESGDIRRRLLAVEATSARFRWLIVGVGVLLAGFLSFLLFAGGSGGPTYRTAKATKADLTIVVTATGTLEPVKEVSVGTEISGVVQGVFAEENDRVKKGQVLARLNTDRLKADHNQVLSSISSAEAAQLEAQATVTEASENLKKLEELHRLSSGLTPSQQDLLAARAAMSRAGARENSARAAIREAKARLAATEINLRKSVIRAPINGIVLLRKIEPGQTVAASFATPELFVIAENLTQLVLKAQVDEADIGRVRVGQEATFTVDAFPGRSFGARIIRVLFASSTSEANGGSESVVTYETTLRVNNSDLALRPGMTATTEILVERLKDVVVVPNAALRFEPPEEAPRKGFVASLIPSPPRRTPRRAKDRSEKRLWVLRDGQPVPMEVRTGSTDGSSTAILSGEIKPGMDVILEMIAGAR